MSHYQTVVRIIHRTEKARESVRRFSASHSAPGCGIAFPGLGPVVQMADRRQLLAILGVHSGKVSMPAARADSRWATTQRSVNRSTWTSHRLKPSTIDPARIDGYGLGFSQWPPSQRHWESKKGIRKLCDTFSLPAGSECSAAVDSLNADLNLPGWLAFATSGMALRLLMTSQQSDCQCGGASRGPERNACSSRLSLRRQM